MKKQQKQDRTSERGRFSAKRKKEAVLRLHGLLRQYLSKGMDLSTLSSKQLDAIAYELNGRPRQTLAWRTPAEVVASAVATTA